ncbi:MAG: HD domain-containing protein [Oscillospiraceae bacterium]|nr:HD domain-containing protein [Oscillospiraceae bacterium]
MNRIELLFDEIEKILDRMTNKDSRRAMNNHLYGVAQAAALIALRRGENTELATMAGILHDIAYCRSCDIEPYRIFDVTGANHAEKGSIAALEILTELNITTLEETRIICDAIKRHSDKNTVDKPFDEVLKDADVFSHGLHNVTSCNFRGERWDRLCEEFGIDNPRINN